MAVTIACNGTDITRYIPEQTIVIKDDIDSRAATCDFRLDLAGNALVNPWNEIIIKDAGGFVQFGGYAVMFDDSSVALNQYTKVSCYDYTQKLSSIMANQVFVEETDVAIIRSLLSTYAPWVDQSLLPSTGTVTMPRIQFNRLDLLASIRRIGDTANMIFWIDGLKKARYVDVTTATVSPFAISDNPDGKASFGAKITKYTRDYSSLTNRIYFYGGVQRTQDTTESIGSQATGTNAVFYTAYPPLPSSIVGDYTNPVSGKTYSKRQIVVVVNGATYYAGQENYDNLIGVNSGTFQVVVNRDAKHLRFAQGYIPPSGATITVTYQYDMPLILVVQDTNSYATYGEWFDGKVSDQKMVDASLAQLRSQTILDQEAYGKTDGTLTLYESGIRAGMSLNIANTVRNISGLFLVRGVTATGIGNGYFKYDVTFGAFNKKLQDHLHALNALLVPEDTYNADFTNEVSDLFTISTFTDAVYASQFTDTPSPTQSNITTFYPGSSYPGFSVPGSN